MKLISGFKLSSININDIRSKESEYEKPGLSPYHDFYQPQTVTIQETTTYSLMSSKELFPETCPYSVYRKDTNPLGGGVMLLTHKDIFLYAHHRIGKQLRISFHMGKSVRKIPSHFAASW